MESNITKPFSRYAHTKNNIKKMYCPDGYILTTVKY